MLQNDRAGIAALPALKSLLLARHLSKTFGSFSLEISMAKKDILTVPTSSDVIHDWLDERLMLMLQWRLDGSEGIHWHLRALTADGGFYGEIRFQSADENRCKAMLGSGQLSPDEIERTTKLLEIILQQPLNAERCPRFGALLEKLPIADTGKNVRLLYEYNLGDERSSDSARAFLELAGFVEGHLSPYIAQVCEPGPFTVVS